MLNGSHKKSVCPFPLTWACLRCLSVCKCSDTALLMALRQRVDIPSACFSCSALKLQETNHLSCRICWTCSHLWVSPVCLCPWGILATLLAGSSICTDVFPEGVRHSAVSNITPWPKCREKTDEQMRKAAGGQLIQVQAWGRWRQKERENGK